LRRLPIVIALPFLVLAAPIGPALFASLVLLN
jgi:hypothetical protein